MDTSKFTCRLGKEGQTPCGEQCAACLRIDNNPIGGDNVVTLRPEAAVEQAAPQGPQIQDELIIRVFTDGNMQITGPFDDRIKFHGLLALATSMENEKFAEARQKVAALQRERASETRLQRWTRERREKQVQAAAQRAYEKAEKMKKDELARELANNEGKK